MKLMNILNRAVDWGVSDVHLTVGLPPVFRKDGKLIPQNSFPILKPDDTEGFTRELLDEEGYRELHKRGERDFAYSLPGKGRFRVNAFRQRGSYGIAVRILNSRIKSLSELNLPRALENFAYKPRGLVLVTGPAGSGKSTTLAALIDIINSKRCCNIITLEDPIEYMHVHKKSIVNQREIGEDTRDFASALRAALRQDPDVILVGEMRDLETISSAITAAETGHLVFATLHTSSASQTVDRVIDVFPYHQQGQIRIQLAESLQGIIAQQLLPRQDGEGMIPAVEIMVATSAIRNQIREGKTHQIPSSIQTGSQYGMQSLDNALLKLFQKGIISREELLNRAGDNSII